MAKKKPASDTTAPAATAPIKTFQSFERMVAKRSSLRFHEANPRTIDASAFRKLRDTLRKVGLVTSLIVNRRDTANGFTPAEHGQLVITGGHQRCKVMDSLQSYDPKTHENDYEIPIDLISVSPARERELLVSLNNPSMQGSWDYALLGDLLTSPGVDPLATGFDRLELQAMLDSGVCEQLFGEQSPQHAAEAPIVDAIAQIAADSKAYQQATAAPAGTATASPDPATPPAEDKNSVEAIKGRREKFQDQVSDSDVGANTLTIVATDAAELGDFLAMVGLPMQPFISLADFLAATGLAEQPAE